MSLVPLALLLPTLKISSLFSGEVDVKITICEHPDSTVESAAAWAGLRAMLEGAQTDLLVLSEPAGIASLDNPKL